MNKVHPAQLIEIEDNQYLSRQSDTHDMYTNILQYLLTFKFPGSLIGKDNIQNQSRQ